MLSNQQLEKNVESLIFAYILIDIASAKLSEKIKIYTLIP